MGILMSMLGQTVGFPVPVGGAGQLTQSLARRFASRRRRGAVLRGGRPRRGDRPPRPRRAARQTETGSRRGTRWWRTSTPCTCTAGWWPPRTCPGRTQRSMRSFQLDPGTVKVDWALDGTVPWASAPPYAPGTFHVADSVEEMTEALAQVDARAVPARPFMLAGQMTTTDPTRSPSGTESLWAYTHVPAGRPARRRRRRHPRVVGRQRLRTLRRPDAGPDRTTRAGVRLPDPRHGGCSGRTSWRRWTPTSSAAPSTAGTSQLHQELFFRPVPGLGRAETPIAGLYLASASAHPGGGVHGAAGMNAARAAVAHRRLDAVVAPVRRSVGPDPLTTGWRPGRVALTRASSSRRSSRRCPRSPWPAGPGPDRCRRARRRW